MGLEVGGKTMGGRNKSFPKTNKTVK